MKYPLQTGAAKPAIVPPSTAIAYHEYLVAEGPSVEELGTAVSSAFAAGWIPLGGLYAVVAPSGQLAFFQALAR